MTESKSIEEFEIYGSIKRPCQDCGKDDFCLAGECDGKLFRLCKGCGKKRFGERFVFKGWGVFGKEKEAEANV